MDLAAVFPDSLLDGPSVPALVGKVPVVPVPGTRHRVNLAVNADHGAFQLAPALDGEIFFHGSPLVCFRLICLRLSLDPDYHLVRVSRDRRYLHEMLGFQPG